MHNRPPLLRLLLIVFVAGISLLWIPTATAQSGRRGNRSTAEPAATPSPVPTPRKPDVEKGTVKFIVGVYRDGLSNIPLAYYSSVAQACAERLDQGQSVRVEFALQDMSRSNAVKLAKGKTEGFVVWLQLKVENLSGNPIISDPAQIYLEYSVFAATTAKTAAWGHTYQQGYRKGGVVVGTPGTTRGNPVYSEILIKKAAAEAAERILETLRIGPPPARRFATWSPRVRTHRDAMTTFREKTLIRKNS